MTAQIHTLPVPLRVVETAPEPSIPVELDGTRVLVRGRIYRTFMGQTAAARVASALMTLEAYGLLDTVRA